MGTKTLILDGENKTKGNNFMGTKTLILDGENLVDGTNITILCDGTSVFSGALSKAVTSGNGDNIGELATWTVDVDTVTEWSTSIRDNGYATIDHSISISVVSGSVNAGMIKIINPQNSDPVNSDWDGVDQRKNILIDGAVPYATEEKGEVFSLAAGDTLTCVVTVTENATGDAANGPYSG
jgi:hypothetical protein